MNSHAQASAKSAERMTDTFKQDMGNVQAGLDNVKHEGFPHRQPTSNPFHNYEQQSQLYEEQFQALHRASSSSDIQRSGLANKLTSMGPQMA